MHCAVIWRILAARLKSQPVAIAQTHPMRCRHGSRAHGIVGMPEPGDELVGPVVVVAFQCRLDVIGS